MAIILEAKLVAMINNNDDSLLSPNKCCKCISSLIMYKNPVTDEKLRHRRLRNLAKVTQLASGRNEI